jgi:hypothetical protein
MEMQTRSVGIEKTNRSAYKGKLWRDTCKWKMYGKVGEEILMSEITGANVLIPWYAFAGMSSDPL